MLLSVTPNTKLSEMKNTFHQGYPFLKLEFYKKSHAWQEGNAVADLLDENLTVADVVDNCKPGFIEIHYWQKTGIIEAKFNNMFGLYAQIFRKKGDDWIQTAGTDEFTLEQQNESGKNSLEELLHGHYNSFENEKKL